MALGVMVDVGNPASAIAFSAARCCLVPVNWVVDVIMVVVMVMVIVRDGSQC